MLFRLAAHRMALCTNNQGRECKHSNKIAESLRNLILVSLAIGVFEKHYTRALGPADCTSSIPVHSQAPRNEPDQRDGLTPSFSLRAKSDKNLLDCGRKLITVC